MNKIYEKLTNVKTKMSNIKVKIANNTAEIVLFIGIICILYATFLVNKVIFLYVLGVILILFSLFIAKFYEK